MLIEYPGCKVRMSRDTARRVTPPGQDASYSVAKAIDDRLIRVTVRSWRNTVRHLCEYGAWTDAEMEDWTDREARIVIAWLAAGDICEEAAAARR